MEYPLADEYTVGGKAQLDRITVSDLTRELEKNVPSNTPHSAGTRVMGSKNQPNP